MVDLLGFADAGCSPTLTTTTDVTAPVGGDSWSQDCVGGIAGAGTDWDSKFMNRLLQQIRVAIRMSGVPLSNAYDNMLSWAMQSGFVNWLQLGFGGTANALTGAAPNAPIAVEGGTLVCGVVETPTNTGAVTFNWSGLGAEPVLRNSGVACTGGEIVNGSFLMLRWDGGSWRIVSPTPDTYIIGEIPPQNPFLLTGVGAVVALTGEFNAADRGSSVPYLIDQTFSFIASGSYTAIGGPSFALIYPSGGTVMSSTTFSDTRWPSGSPPGTWLCMSVSWQNDGSYSLGVISALFIRIA